MMRNGKHVSILGVVLAAVLSAVGCVAEKSVPEPSIAPDLTGKWKLVEYYVGGEQRPIPIEVHCVFEGDKMIMLLDGEPFAESELSVDLSASPQVLDADTGLTIQKGIYKLEGDTMTWAFSDMFQERPTGFDKDQGEEINVRILERVKETEASK